MTDWVSYVRVEASEQQLVDLVLELRDRFGSEHIRSRTLLRFLDDVAARPAEPFREVNVPSWNGSSLRPSGGRHS